MKLFDPTDPFMVNVNGKNIDASMSGLVDKNNQPIARGKGNRLELNKKNREAEIRRQKDTTMDLWFEERIKDLLPKQAAKVKSNSDVEKLLKKHGIQTIQARGINSDYTGIIQGTLLGGLKIIASKLWQWKK